MKTIEQITRDSEAAIRGRMLKELMSLPLDKKETRTKATIKEFTDILGTDNCFVSISGGKDSRVLKDVVEAACGKMKMIMFNTGLEYLETIRYVKSLGAIVIPPTISWVESCEAKGYPVVSKNISEKIKRIGSTPISTAIAMFNSTYGIASKWLHFTSDEFVDFPISGNCCEDFKKAPSRRINMNPIIGTRIEESSDRRSAWKRSGCNSYSADGKHGKSRPLSIWKSVDIDQFIKREKIELSRIYTQYEQKRTGCKICPYGAQMDGSRFDLLNELEPASYKHFIYDTKLGYILMLMNVNIISDQKYMIEKEEVQKRVKQWHKRNKGTDKYLKYKIKLCLKYFAKDQMVKAIEHLRDHTTTKFTNGNDPEAIIQAFKEAKEETGMKVMITYKGISENGKEKVRQVERMMADNATEEDIVEAARTDARASKLKIVMSSIAIETPLW